MSTGLSHLALSTMWMQHRFERLADFAAAARELGFGGIEASHIVTSAMIGDAGVRGMSISSVHFPAPAQPSPFGRPAEALLSSSNEDERRWAVAQGMGSIDFAEAAGARAVCLHLGETPAPVHLEWALEQRFKAGQNLPAGSTPQHRLPRTLREGDQGGFDEYAAAKREVEQARQQVAGPAFAAAQRSLDELASYARPRGIRLGIESRVHHWQIPTWSELGQLLATSDPEVVGFWYDCGHVQVQANLGFHAHQAWLDAYAARIVGVHFHDVVGLRDHLLPGQGELDFGRIQAALPAGAVRVCEFDWYFSAEEIVRGASLL